MDLSRTVSEIDGNFCWKSHNFPTSIYFNAPTDGVPLGIGYWCEGSKNRMGLSDGQKSFKIDLAI